MLGFTPLSTTPLSEESRHEVIGNADFAGTTTITFGQTGDLKANAAIAGSTTIVFGQTGAFSAQAAFAATTTITFAQSGVLNARAALAGTATIVFAQTGALAAAAALAGTATITFGQSGALSAGTALTGTATATFGQTGAFGAQAALTGTTTVTFGQSGDFVAGVGGDANFVGTASITFGQTGDFVAERVPGGGGEIYALSPAVRQQRAVRRRNLIEKLRNGEKIAAEQAEQELSEAVIDAPEDLQEAEETLEALGLYFAEQAAQFEADRLLAIMENLDRLRELNIAAYEGRIQELWDQRIKAEDELMLVLAFAA